MYQSTFRKNAREMMRKPNVIVICSDQHRADAMGCYGSEHCQTPTLDRLAAEGVVMERCYSQNPVCAPARAGLMTGCGTRRNGVPRNGCFLSDEVPTLATLLADEGYATAAFGKTHFVPHQWGVPEAPHYGFQYLESVEDNSIGAYYDYVTREFPEHRDYLTGCLFNLPVNPDFWKGRHDVRDEVERCRRQAVAPHEISPTCNWGYAHRSPMPEAAHKSHWITDRAIEYLDLHDTDTPLFMWVGYVDPHNPFDPPRRYAEMYDPADVGSPVRDDEELRHLPPHTRALASALARFTDDDWRHQRALYYGGITFMDDQIGRLLEAVDNRLDPRETIIVYTSDHGELLGDHGLCGKSAYHYDSAIRTPLIFRWREQLPAGARLGDIVEQLDLAPTLLQACRISPPIMDGKSYFPLLAGDDQSAGRAYAYVESYDGGPEDPTPNPLTWARTIRTERWRATFYPAASHGELYDLLNDPHELRNLWHHPDHGDVIAEHRRLLLDRLILMDYPLRNIPYKV